MFESLLWEGYWRGLAMGALALAGLFNLLVLLANPRNISHLIFSVLTFLTALSIFIYPGTHNQRPALLWDLSHRVWIPLLLFYFIHAIFPALSRRRDSADLALPDLPGGRVWWQRGLLQAAGMATYTGIRVLTPVAFLLSVYALAGGDGVRSLLFVIWHLAVCLCAMVVLAAACVGRHQGWLVVLIGYTIVLYGSLAIGSEDGWLGGALGFALAMVFLMGPNRYRMHRQLQRSRNVLHQANQKLRRLDVLKNRYIVGSAREMRRPLEAMLARSLDIVEDPAYRLSRSQLQALSGVMDMARRMLRRNERAATLFSERETQIQARDFDATGWLSMLAVLLEESCPGLAVRCAISGTPDGEVYADPDLLEAAFRELAENAEQFASRAQAEEGDPDPERTLIELNISEDATQPERLWLEFHEYNARRTAPEIEALSADFLTGGELAAGMGLGLSLVRRIAEAHGAPLQIESGAQEHDVVFRFSLARAGRPVLVPELDYGLKHLRFLLMHDYVEQARREARRLSLRYPAASASLRAVFFESINHPAEHED